MTDYSKTPTSELVRIVATLGYGHGIAAHELDRRIPVPSEPIRFPSERTFIEPKQQPDLVAVRREWQPIETAPVGIRVLVAMRSEKYPPIGIVGFDTPIDMDDPEDRRGRIFSHWMPLPEVPR